eukprot:11185606-Lingulodinium_polyedra.AAC.1
MAYDWSGKRARVRREPAMRLPRPRGLADVGWPRRANHDCGQLRRAGPFCWQGLHLNVASNDVRAPCVVLPVASGT